jgi:hypothetical protein
MTKCLFGNQSQDIETCPMAYIHISGYYPNWRYYLARKELCPNMEGIISCAFCGKISEELFKLIHGPNNIYICDECVGLCNEIIYEEIRKKEPKP